MEFNRWRTVPENLEAREHKLDCVAFWEAVARNADCARRRWQRECLLPLSDGPGPIALSDGTALEVPSDGEVVPYVSCFTLPFHSHFLLADSESEGEKEEASGAPSVNSTAPGRAGDEPSAPPPQRPCAASAEARRQGDEAFRDKHELPTGSTEDLILTMHAVFHCGVGPPMRSYFRCAIRLAFYVTTFLTRQILGVFPGITSSLARRIWDVAIPAGPHEFRLLNGEGDMECPQQAEGSKI